MRDRELIEYYDRRAPEYERIYQRPERRGDLRELAAVLGTLVAGRDVLEVACGTGYWTHLLAPRARSWLATDAAGEALALARSKSYPAGRVAFAMADAYALAAVPGRFDAALAGFWWSHVPRPRLSGFLAQLGRRLVPGSRVVFFDNRYVPGSSLPISRHDAAGNTWQRRRLDDGSEREVLKNFPSAAELLAAAAAAGARARAVVELRYFWCLGYVVPSAAPEEPGSGSGGGRGSGSHAAQARAGAQAQAAAPETR
ncbi:MAG TPA: class I SAM-dependent methyltransferase [Thermoanaerobaculia bacterium]|nr:class I SAM-dependent methyltransferase [Thermoanaerobaculia bacterium]